MTTEQAKPIDPRYSSYEMTTDHPKEANESDKLPTLSISSSHVNLSSAVQEAGPPPSKSALNSVVNYFKSSPLSIAKHLALLPLRTAAVITGVTLALGAQVASILVTGSLGVAGGVARGVNFI